MKRAKLFQELHFPPRKTNHTETQTPTFPPRSSTCFGFAGQEAGAGQPILPNPSCSPGNSNLVFCREVAPGPAPCVDGAGSTRWGLFWCVFGCFTGRELCLREEIASQRQQTFHSSSFSSLVASSPAPCNEAKPWMCLSRPKS